MLVNLLLVLRRSFETRPTLSRVLLTTGTNVIMAIIGLVTGILAARLLGPQGRGDLAAIQIWPTSIATIAMLGLPQALVYYSAREPNNAGRYTGSAMALALLASFPFMAMGYIVMPILLSAQSSDIITAARWYLLLVPLFALVAMPYNSLQGRSDFVFWNGLRVVPSMAWLAILTIAWMFGRTEAQFVAYSYLVALTFLFFPVIYIVVHRVPGPFWPDVRKWRDMLRYGIPSMASDIPQMLNFRLDQMLIAAFLPAKALGLYVVAVSWSSLAHLMPSAMGAVLFPQVASQKTLLQQNHIFVRGTRRGVLLSLAAAIILMALAPVAIPLFFGEKFTMAVMPALVLTVAAAFAGLNRVLTQGLRGLGYPAIVMKAELCGVVVTILSLVSLLKPLGIMGAALASLLGYSAVTLLLVVQSRRITGYSTITFLCPRNTEVTLIWQRVKSYVFMFYKLITN